MISVECPINERICVQILEIDTNTYAVQNEQKKEKKKKEKKQKERKKGRNGKK
jgi:hypothetical protein